MMSIHKVLLLGWSKYKKKIPDASHFKLSIYRQLVLKKFLRKGRAAISRCSFRGGRPNFTL